MSATSVPDKPQFSEHAASLLGSEHWSILATRSMWWNDASSRTAVFLNVLSASVVVLALVADATGFDESFNAFALVLFPIVLFLGVATYVRLVQINSDDVRAMAAMNRIRHAYLEMAPELERYFTASPHDDVPGIITTYTFRASEDSAALAAVRHHDADRRGYHRLDHCCVRDSALRYAL